MKTLLITAAVVTLSVTSALAVSRSGPPSIGPQPAGAASWLVVAGDPNHLHGDGPPGRNLDGENGRPGYGHSDKNHVEPDTGEHDGPPGLDLEDENERPGYGGNPADFEPD